MIILNKKIYILRGISREFFWKELDQITAGQHINPELSYTHWHTANFDNIFAGKKVGNQFSIYLFKPKTNFFRTEILAKGHVEETNDGIRIACNFELPFGSFIKLLIPSLLIFVPLLSYSVLSGIILLSFFVFAYSMLVLSNRDKLQKVMKEEFRKIKNSTKK